MTKTIVVAQEKAVEPMKVVGVSGIDASQSLPLPSTSPWRSAAAEALFEKKEEELFSFLASRRKPVSASPSPKR